MNNDDGISGFKWYVAFVRSCQERKVAGQLNANGIETFVPVQKVRRQWSDRVKMIDRPVLPGMVFVRCSEELRASTFGMTEGLTRYMMDITREAREPLVVPDRQIADFMHVLRVINGEAELSVVNGDIAEGDMVRVVRGPLIGFVCECVEVMNKHNLIIRLGLLGSLLVTVDASDVIKA